VENQQSVLSAAAKFATPDLRRSIFQLTTSLGLFLIACGLTYWAAQVSTLLALALTIPTGGLLVRVFIVQHDCGHGSFFASRRANDVVGTICSLMTLTPYANWRRQHAGHHANWNNLDRRNSGADIYSHCLTVVEYRALSPWRRFFYRVPRHPFVAHLIIPPLVFFMLYRVPFDTPQGWSLERRTVYWTDLVIVAIVVALGLTLGFGSVLVVQVPTVAVAAIVGVWLFAVQHRFEDVRWLRQADWSFATAALGGSSYLRLPRILQWFTGNIGFHHIHHLAPRVPNYRLEQCYRAEPDLRVAKPLSMWSAFHATRLALWDEERQQMVGFKDRGLNR
jgi:acyl-lipid omega-6 desaturase (Delta-12 desaturase)